MQRRFEEKFYKSLLDARLFREAMAALRKAIRNGEAWAITLWLSKGLPQEALKIEVAPDLSKLRDVILEACADHPEVRFKIARRLLEIGQAIDTPFEQVQ